MRPHPTTGPTTDPAADPSAGPAPVPSPRSAGKGLIEVLRLFGLARRAVPRPVVGKKAYVRWWERLRATLLLGAIVVALGFLVAAIIGILVLAAGFLLEQAIS
jgi:hypothetical protein